MFLTPGSALDGWAREELSVSMAYRSLRTHNVRPPLKRHYPVRCASAHCACKRKAISRMASRHHSTTSF
eukprot:2042112-Amphidinium_carterae.1